MSDITLPGGGFTTAEKRRRYGKPCACGCGRLTNGSDGTKTAATYRAECWQRKRRAEAQQKTIVAIRVWHKKHGRIPAAHDWVTGVAPYPTTANVQQYFGSWNAAIKAAGFTPRGIGMREFPKKAA